LRSDRKNELISSVRCMIGLCTQIQFCLAHTSAPALTMGPAARQSFSIPQAPYFRGNRALLGTYSSRRAARRASNVPSRHLYARRSPGHQRPPFEILTGNAISRTALPLEWAARVVARPLKTESCNARRFERAATCAPPMVRVICRVGSLVGHATKSSVKLCARGRPAALPPPATQFVSMSRRRHPEIWPATHQDCGLPRRGSRAAVVGVAAVEDASVASPVAVVRTGTETVLSRWFALCPAPRRPPSALHNEFQCPRSGRHVLT